MPLYSPRNARCKRKGKPLGNNYLHVSPTRPARKHPHAAVQAPERPLQPPPPPHPPRPRPGPPPPPPPKPARHVRGAVRRRSPPAREEPPAGCGTRKHPGCIPVGHLRRKVITVCTIQYQSTVCVIEYQRTVGAIGYRLSRSKALLETSRTLIAARPSRTRRPRRRTAPA